MNLDALGVQAVLEARLHTAERNPERTVVASRLTRLPDEARDVLLASMMLELAGDDTWLVAECINRIAHVSEALDDELGTNVVADLPTLTAALAAVAMKYAAAGATVDFIEEAPR